jgi:hypothetical protein
MACEEVPPIEDLNMAKKPEQERKPSYWGVDINWEDVDHDYIRRSLPALKSGDPALQAKYCIKHEKGFVELMAKAYQSDPKVSRRIVIRPRSFESNKAEYGYFIKGYFATNPDPGIEAVFNWALVKGDGSDDNGEHVFESTSLGEVFEKVYAD